MEARIYKGDIIVKENETLNVDYTEVTGSIYVSPNATFQADALTTIGGYVWGMNHLNNFSLNN